MAKTVFFTQDWGKVKDRIVESPKTQGDVSDLSRKDLTIAGQPALEVDFTKSTSRIRGFYIKAGVHLLNIVFEVPKDEYPEYAKTFEDILASFSFGKDFALEDEAAILARRTQELIADSKNH